MELNNLLYEYTGEDSSYSGMQICPGNQNETSGTRELNV